MASRLRTILTRNEARLHLTKQTTKRPASLVPLPRLGKMKDPKAVDVLLGLLDDEEVVGHALIGLKRLNAQKARPHIEPLMKHPKAWIRKAAMEALVKMR